MRTAVRGFASFLLVALLVSGAQAGLVFDPARLVYTSDTKGHTESELATLFDEVLTQPRPVVLFIHGRGDEPQKSLVRAGFFLRLAGGGRAVHKLESYGTKVVMVSWDSKARGEDRTRPLANMPAAAETLAIVLDAFSAARARHPNAQSKAITLVAHSMGTIALQTYVEKKGGWPFRQPLFTNVVLTSADANGDGHATWVDRIGAVEKVFITVNEKDRVLRESDEQERQGTHPLGRTPGTVLAASATYVHFQTKAHEVFAPDDDRPQLKRFFAAILSNGDASSLLAATGSPNQFNLR